METTIKLTKADVVTRARGLNISIDTTPEDVTIIFDAANDIITLLPGVLDGSGDLMPITALTEETSIEKQAIIELEQHTAEWIPGACSVATVLREICEEHPQYVSAAVRGILRNNANQ